MSNQQKSMIAEVNLPKVMIIGQTFTTDTGGGITLTSLFKQWPKDKLAVAVESKEALDFTKCSNYYRLGFLEQAMPFPFSLFQRKTQSGKVTETVTQGASHVKETNHTKAKFKGYLDTALHHLGLFYWIYGNQKLSSAFINWFKEFNPDIIYYQPNSYKSMGFATALKKVSNKPLVVHVMDDWFSFAVKTSPLKSYWQQQFDQKVRTLFSKAQVHLSICQYMSDAYLKKYGFVFKPYHNSVDLNFWQNSRSKVVEQSESFQLLYAGRIGYGLENAILAVAKVVERMATEDINITLEIQTKDSKHPLMSVLQNLSGVTVSQTIPYNDLPAKFSSADALLIPCDFDEAGLKFIRYSMPTKVSEYMAVGTPVFVVGPNETALVDYALQGWAKVCTSIDAAAIKAALLELMKSTDLRRQIVTKAELLVKQNHNEQDNIQNFRKMMLSVSASTSKDQNLLTV